MKVLKKYPTPVHARHRKKNPSTNTRTSLVCSKGDSSPTLVLTLPKDFHYMVSFLFSS
jgi:hypothetical protein